MAHIGALLFVHIWSTSVTHLAKYRALTGNKDCVSLHAGIDVSVCNNVAI